MSSLKDEMEKADQIEKNEEEKEKQARYKYERKVREFKENEVSPALNEINDNRQGGMVGFIDPKGENPHVGLGSNKDSFVWKFTIFPPTTLDGIVTYTFEYPKKCIHGRKCNFESDHMAILKHGEIVAEFIKTYTDAKIK